MPSPRPEGVGFVAEAPLRAVASRRIPATPEAVFDAIADVDSWPEWFPGMRRCTWLTPPPHEIGSQRRVVVGPLRVDERFVVWDRPRRWGFTFTGSNLPLADAGVEVVDLEPVGDATQVTYTMALAPPRLLAPGARLSVPVMERTLGAALKGLERYLASAPRGV
jgi:uncharacterized protein YndB with AHSA1/START domain